MNDQKPTAMLGDRVAKPVLAPSAGDGAGSSRLDNTRLLNTLKAIVGRGHVLTSPESTPHFRTGFRFGSGPALAVVRPGNMVEQWKVLKACSAANKAIIMQAANTGLTGGSTPDGRDYDREIVIVSTLRMTKIRLINEGRQVICHPGATLFQLEDALEPLGREPHSVIGSSCIGASVFGGICNNSGGALIRRGPAYTQMTLYARIDESGEVQLINHLGVKLGNDPEQILDRLDHDATDRVGSDHHYAQDVGDINADTPGRFNADPKRLFEASGSAGKVMIFAVRLDTFPKERETKVFYIGTNDPAELTKLRRQMLALSDLPVEGEYLHRDALDIAAKYGKDTFLAIRYLGTAWLPTLFAVKARVDALAGRLGIRDFSDGIMQLGSYFFPQHLPKRTREYRDQYEHHLMLKMAGPGIAEARSFLKSILPLAQGAFFECKDSEGEKAFLHRFAAAGAAVCYRAIHRRDVDDIVSLDVALRRNTHKLYYGHFFCHVFHQDYIISKGHSTMEVEHRMSEMLDARGAQYPGRAQCRPPPRGKARHGEPLPRARSVQLLQSGHRSNQQTKVLAETCVGIEQSVVLLHHAAGNLETAPGRLGGQRLERKRTQAMEERDIAGIHLLAHGVDGVGHVEVEHVYAQPLRRLDRRPGRVAAGDDLVWRDGDHLLRRAVGDRRPRRRLAGDRDPAVSSSRDEPRPTTILDVCTAASPGAIAR
jgi:D-lactate dehydrogenase (quinone)